MNRQIVLALLCAVAAGCQSAGPIVTLASTPSARDLVAGETPTAPVEVSSRPPGVEFSIDYGPPLETPQRIYLELSSSGLLAHTSRITADYSRIASTRRIPPETITLNAGEFPPTRIIFARPVDGGTRVITSFW